MTQQINLFDPALQKQYDPWTARNLAIVLASVAVLIAAWGGWAHLQRSRLETEMAALKPQVDAVKAETKLLGDQLANRRPDVALENELKAARARLALRSEVLDVLKKGLAPEAISQADLMRGFARQVPSGLWLTGFEANAETDMLNIQGRTLDPALIPDYVRRLGNEKAFRGRTFAALEVTSPSRASSTGATPVAAPNVAVPNPAAAAPATVPASAGRPTELRYHEFVLKSTHSEAPAAPLPPGGRL